jgi:hypothetical protein
VFLLSHCLFAQIRLLSLFTAPPIVFTALSCLTQDPPYHYRSHSRNRPSFIVVLLSLSAANGELDLTILIQASFTSRITLDTVLLEYLVLCRVCQAGWVLLDLIDLVWNFMPICNQFVRPLLG